jgi:hypothetical protein
MSPPTSSRRRLAVVFGLCAAALLAACGDPSTRSARRQAAGPLLPELRGNILAFDVVVAGDAVAVVEGGADVDGRPRPAVTWFDHLDSLGHRVPLPATAPLFDLHAWWTGEEVAVMGLRCPRWTAPAAPPSLDDDALDPTPKLCGSDTTEAWAFAPEAGAWRKVWSLQAPAGTELWFRDGRGSTGLIESASTGSGRGTYQLLDARTGAVRAAGPPIPDDPGFDVSVTSCLYDAKAVLTISWDETEDGALPAFVRRVGGTRTLRASDGRSLLAVRAIGGAWVPMHLDGPAPDGLDWAECTDDGVVLTGNGHAAILEEHGARARLRDLPPLPPEAFLDDAGASVVAHDEGVTPSIDPDGPRPAGAWILSDGGWRALSGFSYESGLEIEGVIGDRIVSTVEVRDGTEQRGRRVVTS